MDRKTDTEQIGFKDYTTPSYSVTYTGVVLANGAAHNGTFLLICFDRGYFDVVSAETYMRDKKPFEHTIPGEYNPHGIGLQSWIRVFDMGNSEIIYALRA